MIKKEVTRHLVHYFSLGGLIGFAFWGFNNFSYDRTFQSAIAMSLGFSFILWGVIHHHLHEDLHPRIVLEYMATAVLGIIVLLAVIWRA